MSWNFQGNFWKNLQRITETSITFIEKLQRNPTEILKIFGAHSKKYPGRFNALPGTENTANIFQNNILLVSPLTIYCMKMMCASLLAFLQRVYIKNTIAINIDMKKFLIFPSLIINYKDFENYFWINYEFFLARLQMLLSKKEKKAVNKWSKLILIFQCIFAQVLIIFMIIK